MAKVTNKKVLLVALIVDIIDIFINLGVAIVSGSTIMLAETFQGVVDSTSVIILTIGEKRSHKRPSKLHPFGYGKELYFWSSMATFIMIGITATLSFYFGFRQFRNPEHLTNLFLAFIVLGVSLITNGYALHLAVEKLLDGEPFSKIVKIFNESQQLIPKTTLVLDFIGVLMALIGLISLIAVQITGFDKLDGLGAMIIAVLLGIMSLIIITNVKNLIVGQSASIETEEKIRKVVLAHPAVDKILELRTMILGTDVLLVTLDIDLKKSDTMSQVAKIIDSLEAKIRACVPEKTYINIEPQVE